MKDKYENERRKVPRIKRRIYVQCCPCDRTDSWASVTVQDISQGGMSFVSKKEFLAGESARLRVSTFLRNQPVELTANIVDCNKINKGKDWLTRLSIVHINKNDYLVFEEFIRVFHEEIEKGQ